MSKQLRNLLRARPWIKVWKGADLYLHISVNEPPTWLIRGEKMIFCSPFINEAVTCGENSK